jgi:DNA-binding NarL/FixJ family response regulator
MTSPLRILLADDHVLMRAGLRRLVETMEGVMVVGEAGDGAETLRLAESLHPDVVLLDVAMPGLNGLDVAARLSSHAPPIPSVILTGYDSEEFVARALRAGAVGYLLKESAVAELEIAVRAAARGESYLSPAVSRHIVNDYLKRPSDPASPLDSLTQRQREILQLVAEGHTSKDIADRLGLSLKTVESHRAHIMERLGLRDVASLVRFAIRAGLVSA